MRSTRFKPELLIAGLALLFSFHLLIANQKSPVFTQSTAPDPEVANERFSQGDYIDQWEFRSILTLDGRIEFSLHNPWEKISFWARVGDDLHRLSIVRFDADSSTLEVRHDDQTKKLPLLGRSVWEPSQDARPQRAMDREDPAERQARLEAVTRFRRQWEEAEKDSPILQELRSQLVELHQRTLGSPFQADPGKTPEENRRALREYSEARISLIGEQRLLVEEAGIEAKKHAVLAGEEPEVIQQMLVQLTQADFALQGGFGNFGNK